MCVGHSSHSRQHNTDFGVYTQVSLIGLDGHHVRASVGVGCGTCCVIMIRTVQSPSGQLHVMSRR